MRLSCFLRENLIASLTLIAGAIWCHSDWPTLDQMKPGLFGVEETFDDSSFKNIGPMFEMKSPVQDFTVLPCPP